MMIKWEVQVAEGQHVQVGYVGKIMAFRIDKAPIVDQYILRSRLPGLDRMDLVPKYNKDDLKVTALEYLKLWFDELGVQPVQEEE